MADAGYSLAAVPGASLAFNAQRRDRDQQRREQHEIEWSVESTHDRSIDLCHHDVSSQYSSLIRRLWSFKTAALLSRSIEVQRVAHFDPWRIPEGGRNWVEVTCHRRLTDLFAISLAYKQDCDCLIRRHLSVSDIDARTIRPLSVRARSSGPVLDCRSGGVQ